MNDSTNDDTKSRAHELEQLFNELDETDFLPPEEDMHALAVIMRANRMCGRALERACDWAPTEANPAWSREFSFDMQMAFIAGRAYQVAGG
jgi:hypothetical protein